MAKEEDESKVEEKFKGKIKVVMLATLTDGDNTPKKIDREYVVSKEYFEANKKIMKPVKKKK